MATTQEGRGSARRPFDVRLYLAVAFAAVALLAAGLSYVLASGSSQSEAEHSSSEIAVGRTVRLADAVGAMPSRRTPGLVEDRSDATYAAWAYSAAGKLLTPRVSEGVSLGTVPGRRHATRAALRGGRSVKDLAGAITVVSLPVFRDGQPAGAVVARAARAAAVDRALRSLRGHRLTAAIIAVIVAALLGALIASAITTRVKALAESAARISEGRLDEPLHGLRGRDEITDLGRAFETMRLALKDTFGALRSERDRLSAIFEALDDAVIVAGPEGASRFRNPAADDLILADGRVIEALMPWLRRAAARGSIEHDAIQVGDPVHALNARNLPAEGGVLMVVRDRTEELRRELAEREFVSNAAHELRNPIAGLSGAIEVLRSGAKDDPNALEHFLLRLSEDVERMNRLMQSLLTLARVEALPTGEGEAVDVAAAATDAVAALGQDEIEIRVDVDSGLAAEADPLLLRQVLIGLLANAVRHSSPGGSVVLKGRRANGEAMIEVVDTGTGIPAEDVDR